MIDQLARSVSSGGSPHFLVMVTAYCDESGKHDQASHFVIAGLRASTRTWSKIEREWRVALRRHRIKVMHAADCENSYGEFKGMGREQVADIQRSFIKVINRHTLVGLAIAIPREIFDRAVSPIKSARYKKHPYFFVFQGFIGGMAENQHALTRRAKISFVFDRQQEFGGTAQALYNRAKDDPEWEAADRLGAFSFGDKKEIIPLQVADLFAYENYRFIVDLHAKRPIRWQIGKLYRHSGADDMFVLKEWSEKGLSELHRLHEERRQRALKARAAGA